MPEDGPKPPHKPVMTFRRFLMLEGVILLALLFIAQPWEGRQTPTLLDQDAPGTPQTAPGGRVLPAPPVFPATLRVLDDKGQAFVEVDARLGRCRLGGSEAAPLKAAAEGVFPLPTLRWTGDELDEEAPSPIPFGSDCIYIDAPGPVQIPPIPLAPHLGKSFVELTLPRSPELEVYVLGEDGSGLDANLTIEQSRGAQISEALFVEVSRGVASFYLDPAFPVVTMTVSAEGYLDGDHTLDMRDGLPDGPIEVMLSPVQGALLVSCERGDGAPCDGKITRLRCDSPSAEGPAVPSGDETPATVRCPPGSAHKIKGWLLTGGGASMDVPTGATEVKMVLPAADGVVAGSVRDEANGTPLRSFEILWRWAPSTPPEVIIPGATAVKDPEGRFELPGLPKGKWVIGVRAAGYGPVAMGPVKVEGGGITVLAPMSAPRGATVEGAVLLGDGAPAPGATVLALWETDGALARLMPPAEVGSPEGERLRLAGDTKADAQGRFVIGDLAPGTYQFMAYAFERPPLASAQLTAATLKAGERRQNVEIPLSQR